jgi:hypothetical protein
VAVKSLYGNPATIENPWGSERVSVKRASNNMAVLTTAKAEFTFNTTSNTVYIIERVVKPLASYMHKPLTGTANHDAKQLTGSQATLGAAASPAPIRTQP